MSRRWVTLKRLPPPPQRVGEAAVSLPDETLLRAVKWQVTRVELQAVKGEVVNFKNWKAAVAVPVVGCFYDGS